MAFMYSSTLFWLAISIFLALFISYSNKRMKQSIDTMLKQKGFADSEINDPNFEKVVEVTYKDSESSTGKEIRSWGLMILLSFLLFCFTFIRFLYLLFV